jgi:hypothetical protein
MDFRDIPEYEENYMLMTSLIESQIGQSIRARNEALDSFRSLGPPDLVHCVRSSGKEVTTSFTLPDFLGWLISLCFWIGMFIFCLASGLFE